MSSSSSRIFASADSLRSSRLLLRLFSSATWVRIASACSFAPCLINAPISLAMAFCRASAASSSCWVLRRSSSRLSISAMYSRASKCFFFRRLRTSSVCSLICFRVSIWVIYGLCQNEREAAPRNRSLEAASLIPIRPCPNPLGDGGRSILWSSCELPSSRFRLLPVPRRRSDRYAYA